MTSTTGHLTKKDLQSDEVLDTARTGIEWTKGHLHEVGRAGAIAGAVIVVIGGVWGVITWRNHAAGEAVSKAMATLEAPIAGSDPLAQTAPGESFPSAEARKAKVAELMEKAAKSYGSTPAGRIASIDAAAALSAKGDNAGAWTLLEKTADGADGIVRSWAEYDLILVGPAAGKSKETIERINRNLAMTNPPLPGDVLLFSLADVYQKDGKTKEAKDTYQQLVSKYPDSRLRFEAQQKLQIL